MGKEIGKWAIRLLVVASLLIVIAGIGHRIGSDRATRKYRPQVESYQHQIDSMRCRLDSLLAGIDPAFEPKQRVIVKTKIKYIIQKQEDEKREYLALDTTGRVAAFRERLRARMGTN